MAANVVWLPPAKADREFFDAVPRLTTPLLIRSTIWILFAALAFGGIAEAGQAVLCVGEDGHADIEYGLAGCCVVVPDGPEQAAFQSAGSSGARCDDCADLRIEQNSLRAGKEPLPAPETGVVRHAWAQIEFSRADVPEAGLCVAKEAMLTALSSVILLT